MLESLHIPPLNKYELNVVLYPDTPYLKIVNLEQLTRHLALGTPYPFIARLGITYNGLARNGTHNLHQSGLVIADAPLVSGSEQHANLASWTDFDASYFGGNLTIAPNLTFDFTSNTSMPYSSVNGIDFETAALVSLTISRHLGFGIMSEPKGHLVFEI